jgi:O-succinylbenzoic acid--CoA ligase
VASLAPVSGTAAEILDLLLEWEIAGAPEPLMIQTSGSTGRPKRVVLSREAMRASARATHERLGGPGQWVLNLPPTYVAGVQVLYRSIVAGAHPLVPPPGEDRPLWALRDQIDGRAYISLVPTQLIRELRDDDGQGEALRSFDAVLIGGGPLDPRVRFEAEQRGIRIVQTYGMSETCGGCVYDGLPLDGVEMRIEDGQVLLRGPVLFDGYDGEADRSAAALRDGWFHTDDLGHIGDDGRLRIEGRGDDVIISGGVKVPARAVATALAADDAAVAVEVVGVPDDEWGERVVAIVEARDPITLAGLRDLVEPRSWAPRQLVVVSEIPQLGNGKPDRLAMRELAIKEWR